jgi:hypothetical protein
MKRVRIEKVKGRREPRWPEVLPVDPRDVDVLRAKALERTVKRNEVEGPLRSGTDWRWVVSGPSGGKWHDHPHGYGSRRAPTRPPVKPGPR